MENTDAISIAFIDSLSHSFNVSKFALQLEIGRKQLIRIFETTFDATPKNLANKLHMIKASKILENSEIEIASLAKLSGYSSVSGFINRFKGQMRESPAEWRKSHAEMRRILEESAERH